MALTLAFSVTEQGDSKLITITDTTGLYAVGTNPTGWGAPNTTLGDIASGNLTLAIIITTSEGTVTSYDAIDLHDTFLTEGHDEVSDLVFNLNCSMLIDSNDTALGTDEDEFPDGLYDITYTSTYAPETETEAVVLIDGLVKADVYELLRTIPTKYECDDPHDRDVLDIIFIKGYYDSMIATAIVGREAQIIDQLLVLKRIVSNGSSYSW